MRRSPIELGVVLAALVGSLSLLSGCGSDGEPVAPVVPTPATVDITASVIDGAIEGATVCFDKNGNSFCDSDEASGRTAADGSVTLTVPEAEVGKYPLLAMVGTDAVDKDSGPVAAAYAMKAPADQTSVVSPLTTIVQQFVAASKVSSLDAERIIQDQTGIGVSLFTDYTKTRGSDPASAAAGLIARTIVVTTQKQTAALSGAVGQADSSGGTISQSDLDQAVRNALSAMLPKIVAAAADSSLQTACAGAAIGSSDCKAAVQTQAEGLLTQTGLSSTSLPLLVGTSKLLAGAKPDAAVAPTSGAALDFALYGDVSNWYYRVFVSTAAENTPDTNGLIRYREIRRRLVNGALTEWAFNVDPNRRGDVHWNGTAWVDCPFGYQNTQTVRDAEGRNSTDYCDGFQKSNGQRVDVDISGRAMDDVVTTIRGFPSTSNTYTQWGAPPSWFTGPSMIDLTGSTFPAGSALRYQTTTPTAAAFAYDVRDNNVVRQYSSALAAGGDSRGNPASPCVSSEAFVEPTLNAGTLESVISAFKGTPCLLNPTSITVGSVTYTNPNNPSAWWGNSSLGIGTLGSVSISSTPTAYFTGNTNIRVAFPGTGTNSVAYYACQVRFVNGSPRECALIGTGSYSITTLGDARVMTLGNPPALAAALTYHRVFVERGGKVYFGYQNRLIPGSTIRLNLVATNALFARVGVPAVTP